MVTVTDLDTDTPVAIMNPNENPIRIIRRQLNLTQVNLAARAKVSRMVVLRTEQGMYASIPDKLLTQLSTVAGFAVPRRDIQPVYEIWQRDQRMLQSEWVNNPFTVEGTGRRAFINWRRAVSPVGDSAMGFCRLLCIHPNSLRALESGSSRSFPSQISQALIIAGIDQEKLDWLYSLTPDGLSTYGESL